MTGFEPRASGIGSDRSTNSPTTTFPLLYGSNKLTLAKARYEAVQILCPKKYKQNCFKFACQENGFIALPFPMSQCDPIKIAKYL